MTTLTCQYCGRTARYRATSEHLYQGRDYGACWECPSCDAYCGTHPDGSPLGTLANKQLRTLRRQFKSVFNPLWEDIETAYAGIPVKRGHVRQLMRTRAYEWLAEQMNLPVTECHGAMFDECLCGLAIDLINQRQPSALTIREWAKAREPKKARARKAS